MKFVLLAAAAVLAVPAMAQTDQTTPPADQMQPGTATDTAPAGQTAPMDPSMQQGGGTAAPMGGTTGGMAADSNAADPAGGYQPSSPPMQGTAQPGQTVTFQPAPSPSQAFPAPAPLQSYPICKKGQYDNCMQRGGK